MGTTTFGRGIAAAAVLLALAGAGCTVLRGDGTKSTEERTVPDFHAVTELGSVDVRVTAGAAAHHVAVTCDENLVQEVITEVHGGVLDVRVTPGIFLAPTVDCFVAVAAPAVDAVDDHGSGALTVHDAAAIERVVSGGSGVVVVDGVDTATLAATLSGSGDVSLSGVADELSVTSTGSGSVDASGLRAGHATVKASGSGGVSVMATDVVDVVLRGSGSVVVMGSPASRSVDDTGSGSVDFR